MLVKTLKRAVFGFILGMAAGNVIACLTGHPNIVSSALLEKAGSLSAALLWQTLLSGVIGGVAFAGISVYKIDRCSLLLADAAHYAIYMVVFLPIAFFLGWTDDAGQAAVMAVILLAVHTAIFLVMCAYYRAQARELNELNEKRKKMIKQKEIGGTV